MTADICFKLNRTNVTFTQNLGFFNILLKPNLLDQICKAFVLFLFSYTYFCAGILETTKSVALTKCLVIAIFLLLPQFSSMCVFQGGKSRGNSLCKACIQSGRLRGFLSFIKRVLSIAVQTYSDILVCLPSKLKFSKCFHSCLYIAIKIYVWVVMPKCTRYRTSNPKILHSCSFTLASPVYFFLLSLLIQMYLLFLNLSWLWHSPNVHLII